MEIKSRELRIVEEKGKEKIKKRVSVNEKYVNCMCTLYGIETRPFAPYEFEPQIFFQNLAIYPVPPF